MGDELTDEERRERRLAKRREYEAKNREKIRAQKAAWDAKPENRAKAVRRANTWYANNTERAKASRKAWEKRNPGRMAEYTKKWREANPERWRHVYTKSKYGLTDEETARILAHEGLCESCGLDAWEHIDHDHATGAFRGLLCGACNRAAGNVYDDPARARSLAEYLMKFVGELQP